MNVLVKKLSFLLFFTCFQVLLAFFYLTSFESLIIGLSVIFLVIFSFVLKIEFKVEKNSLLLFLTLLILQVLTTFFSQSISLSLNAIIYQFVAFVFFIFFRSLDSSKIIKRSEIVSFILILGLVYSFFYIFFFVFPSFNHMLSSINIITLIYGHSHLAAILLLIIPLVWWFVFNSSFKVVVKYRYILFPFFYTILFFTFGRFALFLSILQLPFLYVLVKKQKINKKLYVLFASLVCIVVVLFISFSLVPKKDCIIPSYSQQVCKNIHSEKRPEYFQQSLKTALSYPLTGYGPGTFSLITKKFSAIAQNSSSYAHNSFLQMIAESGFIVGIVYILLHFNFLSFFVNAFRQRKKITVQHFLIVGVVSLFVNALVDFDWEMLPTYLLTIIIIALIFWDNKKDLITKHVKSIWFLCVTLVIIYSVITTAVGLLVIQGNVSDAFKLFPYSANHLYNFLKTDSLDSDQRTQLFSIYSNHSEVLLKQAEEATNDTEKTLFYEKALERNQWLVTDKGFQDLLYTSGEHKRLGEVAFQAVHILQYAKEHNILDLSERKAESLVYLHYGAIDAMNSGDTNLATQDYEVILNEFYSFSDESEYIDFYRYYLKADPNWNQHVTSFINKLYLTDTENTKKLLKLIYELSQNSKDITQNEFIFVNEALAEVAIKIANTSFQKADFENASDFYLIGTTFDVGVFNKNRPSFIDYQFSNAERTKFWLSMNQVNNESLQIYMNEVGSEYLALFLNALEDENVDLIIYSLEKILKISPWHLDTLEFSFFPRLQLIANKYVLAEDWETAERLISFIAQFNTYSGMLQLGNYYVLTGEISKAEVAYQECSDKWFDLRRNIHKDCTRLLRTQNLDQYVLEYWIVSDTITGDL